MCAFESLDEGINEYKYWLVCEEKYNIGRVLLIDTFVKLVCELSKGK